MLTSCATSQNTDDQLLGDSPSAPLDYNTAQENQARLDRLTAALTVQGQLDDATYISPSYQLCQVSFSKIASTGAPLVNVETRTPTGNKLNFATALQQVNYRDVFIKITDPSFDNTDVQYTMFTKNKAGEAICIESNNGEAIVRKAVFGDQIYATPNQP